MWSNATMRNFIFIFFLNVIFIPNYVLAQTMGQLTNDEEEVFKELNDGKYIPSDDSRLERMRKVDRRKLLELNIQLVQDGAGRQYFHEIPDKVLSMNNEQMTFLINQRNSAIRRKEKLPDGEGNADRFETECSIVLSEKEIYSGACIVVEDKSVSFPMLGVYPSIKDYPYFVIWRHAPTHEKNGRSADMLYWNGKQNISNKAKIFISEIAGQFSSSTSETSVCWSGGKNNLCYNNPSR